MYVAYPFDVKDKEKPERKRKKRPNMPHGSVNLPLHFVAVAQYILS
jgi:hypothetical protein